MPKSSIAIRTPSVVQLLELGARALAGRPFDDDRRLGHLEPEAARRSRPSRGQSALGPSASTPPADSCFPERLTQVTNPSGSSPSRRQRAVCAHASSQDELAERHDQPGRLGDRDELVGRRRRRASASASAGAPRRRRSRCVSSVDLGLVVEAELAALEPEPQLVLEPEQLAELARHVVAGRPRSGRGPPPWPRTSRRRRARISSSLAPAPPGCTTMPMLAPSASSRPATEIGSARRSSSRRATSIALLLVGALERAPRTRRRRAAPACRSGGRPRRSARRPPGAAGRRRRGRGCR